MSWYYSNDGKQLGPVSETDFEASLKAGTITSETLVWREGFPQWVKYGEMSGDATIAVASASTATQGAQDSTKCVECGGSFPQEEMVRFGDNWVCANCKPQHVQKLKEGVAVGRNFVYAGFWVRFGAKFLDGIILQIVNIGIGTILGLFLARKAPAATGLVFVLTMGIQFAYNVYFLGKFGATPGKMALKLKVIRPNGDTLTFGRATGRYFAELLNAFTFGIGYLMVAWDDQKRALHDRIADTRVIRVQA